MPYFPTKPKATIQAAGTYTQSALADSVWSTGKTGTGATTINLEVRISYPTDADPREPRPLLAYLVPGGFEAFDLDWGDVAHSSLVPRGCVVMTAQYRVQNDNPFSDVNTSSDTARTKAIRAGIDDVRRFVDWARANRITDEYIIDPRGIFLMGYSAGAIHSQMYGIENATVEKIAGIINNSGGFGLDGLEGPSDTADLRAFHTEADWVNGNIPVLAFLGGNDTAIGTTPDNWNEDLKDKLILGAENTVYYDAAEGHTAIGDTPPNYGRSDPWGDVAIFMDDIWDALPERGSKLNISA